MTDNLFHKACFITDMHFGRSGNSQTANQDHLDFLQWALDRALSWGAETLIFGGDWFDNRHSIHLATLHASGIGIDRINSAFKKIWWIPGNHDLLYRDKRDVSSISIFTHVPNIKLINDPVVIGDVAFIPWLVGDEHKTTKSLKARYAFGHLELPGLMMNAKVVMPDAPHMLKPDQLAGPEFVFSGHYHMRQQMGNVLYTGNTMPHSFSDAWDEDRGMMLLEWGKEPVFEAWPDQPLYRTAKLSELMDKPKSFLKPKVTMRVSVDQTISFEDLQVLRDGWVSEFDLRKFEWDHVPTTKDEQGFSDNVVFQSVDQIVIEGLMGLHDSPTISKETLVDLYRSLPSI